MVLYTFSIINMFVVIMDKFINLFYDNKLFYNNYDTIDKVIDNLYICSCTSIININDYKNKTRNKFIWL